MYDFEAKWRKQVQLSFSEKELGDLDKLAALDAEENKRRDGRYYYGLYGKPNRSETVKRLVEEELERRVKPGSAGTNGKAKKSVNKKSPN